MPIMPRSNKKAEKIAFNILGKPDNLRKRKSKKIKDYTVPRTDAKYEEFSRITNR